MPKATYMYWQKRFDRENPDKELEEKIQEGADPLVPFEQKNRRHP